MTTTRSLHIGPGIRRPSRNRAAVALELIERIASEDLSAQQVVERIARCIARALDADAFFVAATDPDTGVCLGAGLACSMSEPVCASLWEHEFLVPDYNTFADLTAADPVADLRHATGGRLDRSPRYRTLNAIADLEDELRARLYAGGRSWGNLQLNRCSNGGPFTAADEEFVRAAAPLVGMALRRAVLRDPTGAEAIRGPGVVIAEQTGTAVSVTAEAGAWLRELTAAYHEPSPCPGIRPERMLMPLIVLSRLNTAPRRIRLRTLDGTWLVAHASSFASSTGQVAIVIEPARASEVASIVVDAYGLTGREREVTRLIGRGASTEDIAATLFLSRHTVRDHLKAIFDKVGVCSRGELTYRLFADDDPAPVQRVLRAAEISPSGDLGDCEGTGQTGP